MSSQGSGTSLFNVCFGVEIEAIVEPHTVRHPLTRQVYYEKLAAALRNRGLRAKADDLRGRYEKHSEHYDKWWITKDGSLGDPAHPAIPLEAVSPIMNNLNGLSDIDTFWRAMNAVFHMPAKSKRCGSHIHITPMEISSPRSRHFTLPELQKLAYGIVHYEWLVLQILPTYRYTNPYCRPNTDVSPILSSLIGKKNGMRKIENRIKSAMDLSDLKEIMQGNQRDSRRVLWNFANVEYGGSGTIEFRGGRHLRGPIRTKRWIIFVVAFIRMVLEKNDLDEWHPLPSVEGFYSDLCSEAAREWAFDDILPSDYRVMNETVREQSLSEDFSDGSASYASSDFSDTSSIISKQESIFSDSEEGEEEEEQEYDDKDDEVEAYDKDDEGDTYDKDDEYSYSRSLSPEYYHHRPQRDRPCQVM